MHLRCACENMFMCVLFNLNRSLRAGRDTAKSKPQKIFFVGKKAHPLCWQPEAYKEQIKNPFDVKGSMSTLKRESLFDHL